MVGEISGARGEKVGGGGDLGERLRGGTGGRLALAETRKEEEEEEDGEVAGIGA